MAANPRGFMRQFTGHMCFSLRSVSSYNHALLAETWISLIKDRLVTRAGQFGFTQILLEADVIGLAGRALLMVSVEEVIYRLCLSGRLLFIQKIQMGIQRCGRILRMDCQTYTT
jgi:hypothetical protein